MTNALNKIPEVIRGSKVILSHFEFVERQLIYAMSKNEIQPLLFTPCNVNDSDWVKSVHNSFATRGWHAPSTSCISDISGTEIGYVDKSAVTVDELYKAYEQKAYGVKAHLHEIAAYVIPNFTTKGSVPSDIKSRIKYAERRLLCEMHIVTGFRRGQDSAFRLAFNLQNANRSKFLPIGVRQAVIEYPRVVNGKLGDNLLMWLPVRGRDNVTRRVFRGDATTVIRQVRFGPLRQSAFAPLSIQDNPSIRAAIEKGSLYEQQAVSTLTASSIAILVFPIGLNLVPLALISKITYLEMLVSILLTDTLTVLPLAIKGGELLTISKDRYRAVTVRMSSAMGSDGRKPDSVIAESWASECRVKGNIGATGVTFLVVAFCCWVLGVAAEVLAYWYVRNRYRMGIVEKVEKDWRDDTESSYSNYEYT